jgi:hypothetical protein
MNEHAERRAEREQRPLVDATVWVHADALVHSKRRPYHWTDQCVRGAEGVSLVEIPYAEAEANSNLRPCKLCLAGGKGKAWYRAST